MSQLNIIQSDCSEIYMYDTPAHESSTRRMGTSTIASFANCYEYNEKALKKVQKSPDTIEVNEGNDVTVEEEQQ